VINLDFADVRAVIREMGKAMMGTGEASGDKRALRSAEAAISNPLMDDVSLRGARGLLISITGGKGLTLYEVDEAATRIREEVDADANIIVGATFDESLDGIIRVSVVATGVDINAANNVRPTGTSHALLPTHASASPQARAPRPGVAPSPGAVPFKAEPNVASALAEDAPAEHARERKSSRGLEAELIAVDELCAKLITLAPPDMRRLYPSSRKRHRRSQSNQLEAVNPFSHGHLRNPIKSPRGPTASRGLRSRSGG
jgi:cell division protein FtsZ